MEDKISIICDTCKKEMKSLKEYKKHFSRNHTMRSTGQFQVKGDMITGPNVRIGTAMTNAKAGEEVIVRL